MSQGSLNVPVVGVVTGLTMAQDINNAFNALTSQNSGSSAPTNAAGGTPVLGQLWIDTTSATKPILKQYTGSAWEIIGTIDVTNGIWTPPIGGAKAQTLASATTTDLGSVAASYVTVSGVTTITSLGSSAIEGSIHVVQFSGILTLTHNGSSLILPGSASITTAAGDVAWFVYLAGGNWKCLTYQKLSGAPISTAAVGAQQFITSSSGMNAALNLKIVATVGASALTVAIKGTDGNDPSASNPVLIPFRDPTLTTGDLIFASLQSALSITVASTNGLGLPGSNIPMRCWVCAYYNGGTISVGVFNTVLQGNVIATQLVFYPLPEGSLVTTAASTNGGNSPGVHYANVSTITNTPFRILGYLEWASGLATSGTWASAPTTVQLFGPGIKKSGDIVQSYYTRYSTTSTQFGTVIPLDNTVPQSSEGTQVMLAGITPTSPANFLSIKVSAVVSGVGSGDNMVVGIFTTTAVGSPAIASGAGITNSAASPLAILAEAFTNAGSVTSSTFYARAGAQVNQWVFNGINSSDRLAGTWTNSWMRIDEIMM